MKSKVIKSIVATLIIAAITTLYLSWLEYRPVVIVADHSYKSLNEVIVLNLPLTDRGKIRWWLHNKESLTDLYNIPHPDPDGTFEITFWLFGDGYKEEGKYDRLCFDDMKIKANCIDKNFLLAVSNSRNYGLTFKTDKLMYRLDENGDIVKFNL